MTILTGLLIALTAGVAVAQLVTGTAGNDTLTGTEQADRIKGFGGNDGLFAKGGNDNLIGGAGDDRAYGGAGDDRMSGTPGRDLLFGSNGNDVLTGGFGRDELQASGGDDRVRAQGDSSADNVFCGTGFDVARVDLNDLVGGTRVSDILGSTTTADQDALSCEVLVYNGLRIPLGAIVALEQEEEQQVSLLLEGYLRDGELTPDEITNLEEVFRLVEELEDNPDDETLLGQLVALLRDLIAEL